MELSTLKLRLVKSVERSATIHQGSAPQPALVVVVDLVVHNIIKKLPPKEELNKSDFLRERLGDARFTAK